MILVGKTWQLQTAKNRFSEVVNKAMAGEAQLVSRHGEPAVYVVSVTDFEMMKRTSGKSLKKLLLNSPCKHIVLATDRGSRDMERSVQL